MPQWKLLLRLELEPPEVIALGVAALGFTDGQPISIPSADGARIEHYELGLLDYTMPSRVADLYGQGSSSSSVSASLTLEAFAAGDLLRKGIRLQRIRVRMFWYRVGSGSMAEAVQVWFGTLGQPVIDEEAGVFSFSIETGTREQDAPLPPTSIGDEGRFPNAPPEARTKAIPVLYGGLSNLPVFRIDADPGPSPPAVPTNIRFMICGHQTPDFLCRLGDGDQIQSGLLAPSRARDGRGDLFTYVTVQNTIANWSESAAMLVSVARGHKAPGEDAAPYPQSLDVLVHRLGDVLIHLATVYGRERFLDLDRERIFASRDLLNRFTVGAIFNQSAGGSVLQVLKSRFEKQFPVSFDFVGGRFGWDYTGIPTGYSKPVGTIVWRQNAHQGGPLRPVSADLLRSRFAITYAVDPYAGGSVEALQRDETNDARCQAAWQRWGNPVRLSIDLPDVPSESTAKLVMEDLILRFTKRRIRTSYTVTEPTWINLPLFSRLAVTDPRRGWLDEPVLVEGIQPIEPGLLVLNVITENGL